jgi:flagellar basal-body rod modification protein FlgD
MTTQTNLLPNSASSSNSASTTPAANGVALTSDMFTKLLVAEIQNQDPTAPTDPSTFVNQLAQLSQTESLQNMSNLTSANASVLQSMQVIAMGAQVGASVTADATSVSLGTSPVNGSFTLASGTTKADLVLTGSDGQPHKITLGAHNAGDVSFTIDPAALGLAPGSYSMAVQTSTTEQPAVRIDGTLQSVKLSSSGSVTLVVSNLGDIAPSAVTSFNGPAPPTPTQP